MAADYVRVVYGKVSASIDFDRKMRTFSDIAKAAAVEHLGKSAAAEVPAGALSLRGPVAFTDDLTDAVLAALREIGTVSLGRVIDPTRFTSGAWFLLEIDSTRGVSGMLEANRVCACPNLVLCHFLSTLLSAALSELREGGGAAEASASGEATRVKFRLFASDSRKRESHISPSACAFFSRSPPATGLRLSLRVKLWVNEFASDWEILVCHYHPLAAFVSRRISLFCDSLQVA